MGECSVVNKTTTCEYICLGQQLEGVDPLVHWDAGDLHNATPESYYRAPVLATMNPASHQG